MGLSLSAPAANGFNWYSTAEDVTKDANLEGKTIVVTGANSGIGKESARVLAMRGAFVIMTSRDMARGEEALADIVANGAPEANVKLMQLDLASFKSIRKFADEFKALHKPLHVLLNNAGVMMCPYEKTDDGFEMQSGTNHLGHFLLTHLLMDSILAAGKGARIVNVSSIAHMQCKPGSLPASVDEIVAEWFKTPEDKYGRVTAYGRSKIANIFFTNELQRKYKGQGILAYSVHPGVITTNLGRHVGVPGMAAAQQMLTGLVSKTPQQGAATQVFAAANALAESEEYVGQYLDCSNVGKPTQQAMDVDCAKRFWEASENACGIKW